MILLADENIHRSILQRLHEDGHDIVHVGDLDPGVTDDDVLAMALEREALLLTNDTDFGELVYAEGAHHAGVLLLRLGPMPFTEQATLVAKVLADHGERLHRAYAVLTRTRLRIRE